jgi:hypothetical protein
VKKISALPRIAVPGKLDANEMAGLSKLHTAEENGDEPLITMAVRNGRTIDMPTGELRNAGYDVEQHKSTTTQICRRHYPGELVHLPASEARRLEELGFLIEPSKYEPLPVCKENEVSASLGRTSRDHNTRTMSNGTVTATVLFGTVVGPGPAAADQYGAVPISILWRFCRSGWHK